jgi:hypothetical protein
LVVQEHDGLRLLPESNRRKGSAQVDGPGIHLRPDLHNSVGRLVSQSKHLDEVIMLFHFFVHYISDIIFVSMGYSVVKKLDVILCRFDTDSILANFNLAIGYPMQTFPSNRYRLCSVCPRISHSNFLNQSLISL